MQCKLFLVTILIMSVKSAPHQRIPKESRTQISQQLDQLMLNQIAQQSMEQWILQNQYSSMQHQLMAMQNLQVAKKTLYGSVPALMNLPQQPLLILVPSIIAKTTNRLENFNENYAPNLKLADGDADSVVINDDNEVINPETNIFPQRSVVILPNGQRLIIGSIISAIPFLPFEVNVPDTISWIYNGIAGIIGGIGQRLPFRPRPTTESPVQQNQETMPSAPESISPNQESMMPAKETEMTPTQESQLKLMQKLKYRRPNVGMPIITLPQMIPIQVPVQV